MCGYFFPFLGILAVIFLQHLKNTISLSQLVLLNHACYVEDAFLKTLILIHKIHN